MSINRKDNPSLKDYKMITRKKNWIQYVPKEKGESDMDPDALRILTELKTFY